MKYTEFYLDDGSRYKLRLSLLDMIMIERRLGVNPLIVITEPSLMTTENIATIFDYALMHKHTFDDACEIIDSITDSSCEELVLILAQLFRDTGFFDEENNSKETSNGEGDSKADNIDKPKTLEQEIKDMLTNCLDLGISEDDFWDSTYGEIIRLAKSINNRESNRLKEKAIFDLKLADLIGISVARLLSKETKLPTLEEAYPNIFNLSPEERSAQEEKRHLEQMRARLLEYASWHNDKMARKKAKEEQKKED